MERPWCQQGEVLGMEADATTSCYLGSNSLGGHRVLNTIRVLMDIGGQRVEKSSRWHDTAWKHRGETEDEAVASRAQENTVQKAQVAPIVSISQSERCRGGYIRGRATGGTGGGRRWRPQNGRVCWCFQHPKRGLGGRSAPPLLVRGNGCMAAPPIQRA